MAIPKETVDRIFDAAKIEDVVGDYVSLKKKGTHLWGLCPFHNEKTPSFSVYPARNIYKCFGCGKGGSAVNFIIEMEQCSYPEALRMLAHKYHIEIQERELTPEEKQKQDDRESMFVVNEWAHKWFQDQLWNTEEGQAIGLSYFRSRGLRDETIRRFGLGYSPAKGNPMSRAALKEGFQEKYLISDAESGIGTGLIGRSGAEGDKKPQLYDRYRDRVIFPFYSVSGKVVGFAGRILVKKDNTGKYVNSPESIVYTKGRELYGMCQAKQAISKEQKCYLVEGQMDCISMSQAGIENVVCSGGTGLTKGQIALIHRFTDNVTILYDGDAAGVHAALRGIDMFLEQGLNVKVMLFPDGDDPDSFSRKHTAEEFVEYIRAHEEDFISYKTRTLLADARSDIHKRSEAIHSIVHSIALIGDKILQSEYIKLCSQLMDHDILSLTKAVSKERQTIYSKDKETSDDSSSDSQHDSNGDNVAEKQHRTAEPEPDGGVHTPFDMLDANSRNLLRMLVQYGDRQMLFLGPDGQTSYSYLVGDYIQQYMEHAVIKFENPLYQAFIDEFNRHKAETDFSATNCFIRNENQYIAQLAADLLYSRHQLSRIYTKDKKEGEELTPEEVQNQVIHLLYEMHYTVVENSLRNLDRQMQEASEAGNEQMIFTVMSAQKQLGELKRSIGELLGKN